MKSTKQQQTAPKRTANSVTLTSKSLVAKDAKAIENRIKETVLHPGYLHSSGRRHGRLVRTSIRDTQHGECHTYRGVERLGEIRVPVDTAEGDVLDVVQLNPTAFGAVLPQFALPFAKFLFKRVEFEEIPETSQINEEASGSVYFGLNFDPDAELPFGPTGPADVATWAPNDDVLPIKATKARWLKARLDTSSQIPLFVGKTGDEKFESQAQMIELAGTDLNTGGSGVLAAGEWFIHFEVEMYQLNTTPSDIRGAQVFGYSPNAVNDAGGVAQLDSFQWAGDGDVVITPAPSGANFVVPTNGTYVVELDSVGIAPAATISSTASLAFFSVPNVKDPVPISTDCFLKDSKFGGVFSASMDVRGSITTTSNWRGEDGSSIIPGTTNPTCRRTWAFQAVQGSIFRLTLAAYSTGNQYAWLKITRLNNIFHPDGSLAVRNTLNTTLSFSAQRTLFHAKKEYAALTLSANEIAVLKLTLVRYLLEHRPKLDESMVAVLIDKLDLPIEKRTTTTMILPALAVVASWAVATFGPILAEKACRWIERKLDGK